MSFPDVAGPAAYIAVLVAAIVEGEVVFVIAAALVSQGRLNPIGVAAAGAAGAAIGDQFYFYVFRGRLRSWLDRYPAIARRGQALVARVQRHDTLTVLAIRFSPGLRIALSAACAYAGVPPLKFSLLNGLASVAWSAGLLAIVAWLGPKWLPGVGLSGWWTAIVPAILIVVLFKTITTVEHRAP